MFSLYHQLRLISISPQADILLEIDNLENIFEGGKPMVEHDLTESQLIGSRIREARIKRHMSQADLAVKANISLPHISNIEKGKTSMKLESFIRIIEALQVSADSLLRPDVPEVRSLYQSEFDELLADCSPKELDSILKIVRELKSTIARRDDNI